jgi:thiol-disulfide isomerase/thioredoxin
MNTPFRILLVAGALCAAAVQVRAADAPAAAVPAGAAATPGAALLVKGDLAPDFLMKDVAGKDVRLSAFKGKVIILDFWATWCGPCIASMPHTDEIAAKYADQGVLVVASGTSAMPFPAPTPDVPQSVGLPGKPSGPLPQPVRWHSAGPARARDTSV